MRDERVRARDGSDGVMEGIFSRVGTIAMRESGRPDGLGGWMSS